MELRVNPATGNRAPELYRALPGLTLQVGGSAVSVSMNRHFRDPEGGQLTYGVSISPAGIVSPTDLRNTDTVEFTPVAAGTATATVTARDPEGLETQGTMELRVNPATGNQAPELYRVLPNLTLQVGGSAVSVSMNRHFRDPEGGQLTYGVSISPAGIVSPTDLRNTDTVEFTPVAAGTATATVTARDP